MVAYKDSLSYDEIDAVTAFLRRRASGWDVQQPVIVNIPTPDEYVLIPTHQRIGDELGTNRVVISRLLRKLDNDKKQLIYN